MQLTLQIGVVNIEFNGPSLILLSGMDFDAAHSKWAESHIKLFTLIVLEMASNL